MGKPNPPEDGPQPTSITSITNDPFDDELLDSFDDDLLDSFDAQLIEAFSKPEINMPVVGQQIDGRFALESKLGQGGMGWVYVARHLATDGQVALKVMDPCLGAKGKMRFAMEARNAAMLTHPNTVRVLDYGQDGDHPFLVMELLKGASLGEVLKSQGPFDLRRTVSIASQVLKSLWEAHDNEIVHRDIKPANVFLISQQGTTDFVKVLDFGISHNLNALADPSQSIVGSPYAMAPEQWQGKDPTPQTDLYAVGCLVYQMLCGQAPFKGPSLPELGIQHMQHALSFDPGSFPPPSAPLQGWIAWMMSKSPSERPHSAKHALQALEQVAKTNLSIPKRRANLARLAQSAPTHQGSEPPQTEDARVSTPALPESSSHSKSGARHNLTLNPSPLIGRGKELEQLKALVIEEGKRLVTVVGLGGVGKTSLLREFAGQCIESWPGEIWFCDLTKVTGEDELWHAVTQAMGIMLTQKDHQKQFIDMLNTRERPLLLMDNFEQITHLAPKTVAKWMAAAPNATFLASSREPLAIANEHLVRLLPFDLPDPQDGLESAAKNHAVACFVHKARQLKPDFELTDDNVGDIVELVRQLDGLPLALELAAARVSVLTPALILQRLTERFKLLRSRRQDANPHQTTLKGTLDWSWDQLTAYEQEALRQCSVFRGSFTLEAAEAVLDLSQWPDAPWVMDLLQNLQDKSWLATSHKTKTAHQTRFKLYVTIRQYALFQRQQWLQTQPSNTTPDQDHALTLRHAQYYCALPLEYAVWERNHNPHNIAITEYDNLLAIAQSQHRQEAYKATLAVANHHYHFGPYHTALHLLRDWLQSPPADPHQHLRLLTAYIYLARAASEYDPERAAQALALAQELGEALMEGWIWLLIGLRKRQTEAAQAQPCAEDYKALAIGQQTQNHLLQGWAYHHLGIQNRKLGNNDQAIEHYQQALHHARQHPSLFLENTASHSLGVCFKLQGKLHEATDHYLHALDLATQLGRTVTRAWLLRALAGIYELFGNHNQAIKLVDRARMLANQTGNKLLEGWSNYTLGLYCANQGQRAKAIDAFAQGLKIAELIQSPQLRGEILGEWVLIDLHMDNLTSAQTRMEESLALVEASGDKYGLAMILSHQTKLQHALKEHPQAAATLARAETICKEITADPQSILGRRMKEARALVDNAPKTPHASPLNR